MAHKSSETRKKLAELNWELMPHPPFSLDLAPSDYYLFRTIQNFLNSKEFENEEEIETEVKKFFNSKDKKFFQKGIFQLSEKWAKVVEQNGHYIVD